MLKGLILLGAWSSLALAGFFAERNDEKWVKFVGFDENMTVNAEDIPAMSVRGKLAEGVKATLVMGSSSVFLDGSFDVEIPLREEPEVFEWKLKKEDTGEKLRWKFTYKWMKPPPKDLGIKVRSSGSKEDLKNTVVFVYPVKEWVELSWVGEPVAETPSPTIEVVAPLDARAERAWYKNMLVGMIAVFPTTGGNSYSPQFSWYPTLRLSDRFLVRGVAAISITKHNDRTWFVTPAASLLLSYQWAPWYLEIGPQVQSWFGLGGTHPAIQIFLARDLSSERMRFIDRFFVGYSIFLAEGFNVNGLQVGLGIGI